VRVRVKAAYIENDICSIGLDELVIPRGSGRSDLVPRKLGELNRIQRDGSAPPVNENPTFTLRVRVERLGQLESSRSEQGLECGVESRYVRVRVGTGWRCNGMTYGIPVAATSSKVYVPLGTFQMMSEYALAYSAKAPRPLSIPTDQREHRW